MKFNIVYSLYGSLYNIIDHCYSNFCLCFSMTMHKLPLSSTLNNKKKNNDNDDDGKVFNINPLIGYLHPLSI